MRYFIYLFLWIRFIGFKELVVDGDRKSVCSSLMMVCNRESGIMDKQDLITVKKWVEFGNELVIELRKNKG